MSLRKQNVESVAFRTEDSRNILHIFPKPVFVVLNVPRSEEIYSLLAPNINTSDATDKKVHTALRVWISFFLKYPQHSFLESISLKALPT